YVQEVMNKNVLCASQTKPRTWSSGAYNSICSNRSRKHSMNTASTCLTNIKSTWSVKKRHNGRCGLGPVWIRRQFFRKQMNGQPNEQQALSTSGFGPHVTESRRSGQIGSSAYCFR